MKVALWSLVGALWYVAFLIRLSNVVKENRFLLWLLPYFVAELLKKMNFVNGRPS